MNNKVTCAMAAMMLIFALPIMAAPPAWNGTWKVDVSKSNIPGPSFTLTNTASGKYHIENGNSGYTFGCDGGDYPTSAGHEISCTLSGSSIMNTTAKENGKMLRTVKWELSADGSRLTQTSTERQPDKSLKMNSNVFIRTSGLAGFAGGWTNQNRLESHPRLILEMRDSSLHIAFPEAQQFADVRINGPDAVFRGPRMLNGVTVAVESNGSLELRTTKKVNGVVVNQGFLRLSADGRTLTEEYWSPSRPSQKAVLVYHKQ